MESTKSQFLEIEPKKVLYFEGPFTDTVVSYIHLTNTQDYAVCFKVKTTVPKRYCVRPSGGILQPGGNLKVAVMLQPFAYDPLEKNKHKFMIQSMRLPEGDNPVLDQVWKEADPAKITDSKLVCVLRMPGELIVEPNLELVFEGPFNKPVSSTITLNNLSRHRTCFKLQLSSKLSASPSSGVLEPDELCKILVKVKPFEPSLSDSPREFILIKSHTIDDSETRTPDELLESNETTNTSLKCVFSTPGLVQDDKIKPVKQSLSMASTAESSSKGPTVETLMAELTMLRNENKSLKESDIHLRRTALSDTCLTSAADGGAAIGRQGALGAIASVPPILYLILALLIGLILGKFAL